MSAVRTPIAPIAWLIAPSALLFALFFFLPMGLMAMISLLTGNPVVQPHVAFTGKYYQRLVSDPYYFEVICTTLRIGLLTTLAALVIGYPLAHWMARIRGRTAAAGLSRSDAAAEPARHPGRLAVGVRAGDQRLCHPDPDGRLPDHDAADADLPADRRELQCRLRRRARHGAAGHLAGAGDRL